jgi:hypothetical protein
MQTGYVFEGEHNVPSCMKAKFSHTTTRALVAFIWLNFAPCIKLSYSFGKNLSYDALFPYSLNALQRLQSLQGHMPNYPVILEILHQLCHIFKAGKLLFVVGYLAINISRD